MSKALTLLEAGDLGVLSFGEKTKVLHQLGEPFTEQSGARQVNFPIHLHILVVARMAFYPLCLQYGFGLSLPYWWSCNLISLLNWLT